MKIIKNGDPQTTQCTCHACNCIFEVDLVKDHCRETSYLLLDARFIIRHYITKCPWCGHEVEFTIPD